MQLLSSLDENTFDRNTIWGEGVSYIRAKLAVTWVVQVASRGQES
jgi:hypothetical protein